VAVVVSWFVVVVSYTVHYARKDAEHPGLRFPVMGRPDSPTTSTSP